MGTGSELPVEAGHAPVDYEYLDPNAWTIAALASSPRVRLRPITNTQLPKPVPGTVFLKKRCRGRGMRYKVNGGAGMTDTTLVRAHDVGSVVQRARF